MIRIPADDIQKLGPNTIRMLAVDAIEKAKSGHPGLPMGAADLAWVLWTEFLNYNPHDPHWLNRDRFILSAGHGSMLLYGLLHLAGFDISVDDLKHFRQWGSKTPGHPEHELTVGVETTTGPLGQGFANGIGMALAARMREARYNTKDHTVFNHYLYGLVSDGDLMEGVTSEAASFAGHYKLGNIIYIYDDNRITIEGSTSLTFSDDTATRFTAYGWQVEKIDGYDHNAIRNAIKHAQQEKEKPSLIIARTHIGYGSPNKQDTADVHGAPLGEEETALTKEKLGWRYSTFTVPPEVKQVFQKHTEECRITYDKWQQNFTDWKRKNPPLANALEKSLSDNDYLNLEDALIAVAETGKAAATRSIGGQVLQKAAELFPHLIGGSADLMPSNKTKIVESKSIKPGQYSGRNIHFGIREHAMASICNGIALYGGFIPFCSTFFVFSDYMRPALRLSAIMKVQVIYVFTHDSIFVGEDGPTHQPIEHLAAIRAIPGLVLFRPADGVETACAWAYALKRREGPTVICLTRQKVPPLTRKRSFQIDQVGKGGYILQKETKSPPDAVLVATGSEVSLAVDVSKLLQETGLDLRVVSMPAFELFLRQSESYRKKIVPENTIPLIVLETGVEQGWHRLSRSPLLFIGMDRFGASAPAAVLAEKFGFTAESAAGKIKKWLKSLQ